MQINQGLIPRCSHISFAYSLSPKGIALLLGCVLYLAIRFAFAAQLPVVSFSCFRACLPRAPDRTPRTPALLSVTLAFSLASHLLPAPRRQHNSPKPAPSRPHSCRLILIGCHITTRVNRKKKGICKEHIHTSCAILCFDWFCSLERVDKRSHRPRTVLRLRSQSFLIK